MIRLVYLSPVPWTSFSQRPHKFVERFHALTNGSVLWIDPYPARFPKLSDFRRLGHSLDLTGLRAPNWLTVLRPSAIPIEPLPYSGKINKVFWHSICRAVEGFICSEPAILAIGKPSELALLLLERGGFKFTIYDAMDDFPSFHMGLSRSSMKSRENKIVSSVSKMIVSSSKLQARWLSCKNTILVNNACDVDRLPSVELCVNNMTNGLIGYVGTLGKWFDWEFVNRIAQKKPDINIDLIGPLLESPPDNLMPNISILPPCSHVDAIKSMQRFTVGLIPFKRNELTESVDPIKYYEYRALGMPVISSLFGEMYFHQKDPGVFIVDDERDVGEIIDSALAFRDIADAISRFRINNSWAARFGSIDLFK